MNKIIRDFVSDEKREYKFKLGNVIASSLSGFIGGLVAAVLVFATLRYLELL